MKLLFFLLATFTLCAKESHPVTTIKQWCKEEKALTEGRYLILGNLASVSPNGMSHTRMIEVSHLDKKKGALFFTHKNTRKAKDFETNHNIHKEYYSLFPNVDASPRTDLILPQPHSTFILFADMDYVNS